MTDETPNVSLPKGEPIQKLLSPLKRFLHVEAAGGVVLVVATLVALVWANLPAGDSFLAFWKTKVGFSFGSAKMVHPLYHWINDGLMAIFFFVMGLEVKRELVLGELNQPRKAMLPISAALGGMVVPAALFLLVLQGRTGTDGWGIPMATDIAFVVGCMALLGSRIPPSLRITLLSLAIADDLGAILVIAVGYTDTIHTTALLLGVAGLALVVVFQRLGVRNMPTYWGLGALIWLAFHESGVHATIAGVLLGLLTPAKNYMSTGYVGELLENAGRVFRGDGWESEAEKTKNVHKVQKAAKEAVSPLEYLIHSLHPWVSFVIMPLFALANAGVVIQLDGFTSPIALAILAGLLVGKPVGILAFSWLGVKLGLTDLPKGVAWTHLLGGSLLAGIGFTMSLFIAGLALGGDQLDAAKLGILSASILSGVLGMAVLLSSSGSSEASPSEPVGLEQNLE